MRNKQQALLPYECHHYSTLIDHVLWLWFLASVRSFPRVYRDLLPPSPIACSVWAPTEGDVKRRRRTMPSCLPRSSLCLPDYVLPSSASAAQGFKKAALLHGNCFLRATIRRQLPDNGTPPPPVESAAGAGFTSSFVKLRTIRRLWRRGVFPTAVCLRILPWIIEPASVIGARERHTQVGPGPNSHWSVRPKRKDKKSHAPSKRNVKSGRRHHGPRCSHSCKRRQHRRSRSLSSGPSPHCHGHWRERNPEACPGCDPSGWRWKKRTWSRYNGPRTRRAAV